MDLLLRYELDRCITELYQVAAALEDAADEVGRSIQGMSTRQYTNSLYNSADRYRRAANKLARIK